MYWIHAFTFLAYVNTIFTKVVKRCRLLEQLLRCLLVRYHLSSNLHSLHRLLKRHNFLSLPKRNHSPQNPVYLNDPIYSQKKRRHLHYEHNSRKAKPPCSICFQGTPVNQHHLHSRLRLPKWHPQLLRYTVCPSEVVYSGDTWKLSSQKGLVTGFCFRSVLTRPKFAQTNYRRCYFPTVCEYLSYPGCKECLKVSWKCFLRFEEVITLALHKER